MRQKLTYILKRHTLWIALLLHLLLFLYFFLNISWVVPVAPEQRPEMDVSSYVYHEPAVSAVPTSQAVPTDKNGLKKPVPASQAQSTTASTASPNESLASTSSPNSQAIHLVGNDKVVKPLLKLIGRALAEHLIYPKIAEDFGVRGTAYVGFMLHPDGQVTESQLVRSSGNTMLDHAAVAGVAAMSPIDGVSRYLQDPKAMVVGIIFR